MFIKIENIKRPHKRPWGSGQFSMDSEYTVRFTDLKTIKIGKEELKRIQ